MNKGPKTVEIALALGGTAFALVVTLSLATLTSLGAGWSWIG